MLSRIVYTCTGAPSHKFGLHPSTGLAANRQNFVNIDYAAFSDSDLEPFSITVRQTKGETLDNKETACIMNLRS